MSQLALYRKWRPQRFSEVVGQEHISRTLLNALTQDRLAHAYLFCGPRGTGKTTSARLLAKALNCSQPEQGEPCNQCQNCQEITAGHSLDVIEIDAASNRGIDSARDLREQVRFSASNGRYRVFIIDEFHMLTKEAFNALLKTLEEPPEQVIFVLATTEAHKVLPTVVSRCQRFDFQRISPRQMSEHLIKVARAEQIGVSQVALEAMARKANGGLRDALSLLDQVRAMIMPGETLPDALVYQTLGLVQEDELFAILTHAFGGELEPMLANVRQLLEQGHDPLQILAELIQILRHLSLAILSAERLEQLGVPSHLIDAIHALGRQLSRTQIVTALDLLLKTSDRLHHAAQPDIWLEADLICLCLQGEKSMLERIEALEHGLTVGPVARPEHVVRVPARAVPAAQPSSQAAPSAATPVRQEPPAASIPLPPAISSVPLSEPAKAPSQETPVASAPAAPTEHQDMGMFEPEPAAPAAPAAPVNLNDLTALWKAFLEQVKAHQRPLIGFLLNGKLVEVNSHLKLWMVEFQSKTHCERVRHSIKNGKINGLVSTVMNENYIMEARIAGEGPIKPAGNGGGDSPAALPRPAESVPVTRPAPPAPAASSTETAAYPSAPARTTQVQEKPLEYTSEPQTDLLPQDPFGVDMDYLPEPPESLLAAADYPVELDEYRPVQMPLRRIENPPEFSAAPMTMPRNVSQVNPLEQSSSSLQTPSFAPAPNPVSVDVLEASRRSTQPIDVVAELFKGKVIDK